jgi:hypothetical protein
MQSRIEPRIPQCVHMPEPRAAAFTPHPRDHARALAAASGLGVVRAAVQLARPWPVSLAVDHAFERAPLALDGALDTRIHLLTGHIGARLRAQSLGRRPATKAPGGTATAGVPASARRSPSSRPAVILPPPVLSRSTSHPIMGRGE